MASLMITHPEQFNFSCHDNWPKWISRFDRFREASELMTKSEERQVNTLIYNMGGKANDILTSFALSADERKQYATMKEKFNRYFVKKHNVIFERAKFNSQRQQKGKRQLTILLQIYTVWLSIVLMESFIVK